jgi:hypothetical protein
VIWRILEGNRARCKEEEEEEGGEEEEEEEEDINDINRHVRIVQATMKAICIKK